MDGLRLSGIGWVVHRVADNGVADVGEVDPDLVGAAGFWGDFD